ncbi:MAG: UvrD-helicase domain-containing protein [Nitrospiraceae bacterium]|nr:UvrD-helicase domain-containing protein [Nitrospiraceae bacterium]
MDIERKIARLNPRQKEAVLHTEGPLLILAGAGSGKTRVITMRAAYLLHRGAAPRSVLAVTFTNKAAREMRERVAAMVRGGGNGSPVISTFHSLCLNILRREIEHLGFRKDFTVYDTGEQISLLRNILSDIRFHDKTFRIESVLERISRSKNDCVPAAAMASSDDDKIEEVTERLYPRYHEALRTLNALDFDDLLLFALKLFREHPAVLQRYRERFRYLMVDEYQDTNRVQYEFVGMLAGERKNLCVVGDDDQSIYGWRGAHPGNILDFEKDFPGTAVIRLEQNYRSTGHILQAANAVIKNNEKRMEKTLWTAGAPGPRVRIFRAANAEDEARWVADRISMIRLDRNLRWEDFAIIYRANLFSRPFEEALRKLRVPYSVVGGTSYFENREIKDLAAYLKIISNSRDDLSLLRAANVPKRGIGTTALGRLSVFARERSISLLEAFSRAREIAELGAKTAGSAEGFAGMIGRYQSAFQKRRVMAETFAALVEEIRYRDYIRELYKTPEAAMRKIENLDAFISSLSGYAAEEAAPTLQGFLETLALSDFIEEKEEKTGSGVTLISFHSAKGLEFPVVFICGVEEDILPHKKSSGTADAVEEERRLFYVGITRAMKELYMTYAGHRTKYGRQSAVNPSRFLDEIPDEALKRLNNEAPDAEDEERFARKSLAHIKAMLGE